MNNLNLILSYFLEEYNKWNFKIIKDFCLKLWIDFELFILFLFNTINLKTNLNYLEKTKAIFLLQRPNNYFFEIKKKYEDYIKFLDNRKIKEYKKYINKNNFNLKIIKYINDLS